MLPHERLIVALDLPEREAILTVAQRLRGRVGLVKVGLEAFVAHGPQLVRALRDLDLDVFLDLKLHDIPRTARAAAARAAALDVRMLTVHASGGAEMVAEVCAAVGASVRVLAVTVLTSLGPQQAAAVGLGPDIASTAQSLGQLAVAQGAAGLVCSRWELEALASVGGVRVVPGIRSAGAVADDQRRVATPATALAAGADFIVVGRPVLTAAHPEQAADALVAEIARASETTTAEPKDGARG